MISVALLLDPGLGLALSECTQWWSCSTTLCVGSICRKATPRTYNTCSCKVPFIL